MSLRQPRATRAFCRARIGLCWLLFPLLWGAPGFAQLETEEEWTELSLEYLLELRIVSASKQPEVMFESPVAISAITAEEIESAGATSWGEALRLLPGMMVREQTPGNFDIHVRGFDNVPPDQFMYYLANTLTLVMIDNRIVYNYFAGGTFWETLPVSLAQVARIEVVRGPASALYGPNAVAGVIHIITKEPSRDGFFTDVHLTGGEDRTQMVDFRLGHGDVAWAWYVAGKSHRRDRDFTDYFSNALSTYVATPDDLVHPENFETPPENAVRFPDPDNAQDNWALTAGVSYVTENDWRWQLTAGRQDSDVQITYFQSPVSPLNAFFSDSNFVDLTVKGNDLSIQLSWLDGDQEAPGVNGWAWAFTTLDLTVEYEHTISDRWKVRPGVSYRDAEYDGSFISGNQTITTQAAYLRSDWRPSDRWRLVAALRGDRYDTPDATELSGQGALNYMPDERHHWRLIYGTAHRTPFFLDTYFSDVMVNPSGATFLLTGNTELELLSTDSVEVGYRFKPREDRQFEMEVYYARNKDYAGNTIIFRGETEDGFLLRGQHQNLPADPRLVGATLSYSHGLGKHAYLRSFLSWTDTEIINHRRLSEPERDVDHIGTPEFFGGLVYDVHLNRRWHLNGNLFAFDGHTQTNLTRASDIPTKWTLNGKVRYKPFNHISFALNVRNLLDRDTHEFYWSDEIGRRIFFEFQVRY
ncbi:TonB-dependent receptor [Sulfidibacter corallicola]|uniref:TonB-dependent receptor n=1 Tax=Sulfidibacter corallicola TaxID=2818388 RepID=A0A8A4TQY6_SULCO|nr:TonB-dependent receptor [Sulfidibacter corallicola]QTD51943.1 TonB-dependent receptor [Sulfidibacter corallicola]